MSLCDNVQKLPAGHAARLDISTLRLSKWRYWELPRLRADANAESTNLVDEAQKLLLDSVRLRLIADVPLGVLLSGGLDSSLVVAAAARASPKPVQTFTIALPGSALDESRHAQAVAAHFGTEHHRLDLDQPSLRIIDEFAPFVDEPLADSSLLPTFVVSRLTRQHVTVALGGDGGDEIFGGYNDYPAARALALGRGPGAGSTRVGRGVQQGAVRCEGRAERFFSRLNRDTYTRRCFEIPAAGTLMLCDYSDHAATLFAPGREADFFRDAGGICGEAQGIHV